MARSLEPWFVHVNGGAAARVQPAFVVCQSVNGPDFQGTAAS